MILLFERKSGLAKGKKEKKKGLRYSLVVFFFFFFVFFLLKKRGKTWERTQEWGIILSHYLFFSFVVSFLSQHHNYPFFTHLCRFKRKLRKISLKQSLLWIELRTRFPVWTKLP